MPPKLEYFKMNEAVKRKGQFERRRFTEAERNQRLALFYGTIEKHVRAFVSCIVPFDAFDAAKAISPLRFGLTPYHMAFMAIMSGLRERKQDLGINEHVDFIFDEEKMEETELVDGWAYIKKGLSDEERKLV